MAGLALQAGKCHYAKNISCLSGTLSIDGVQVPRAHHDVIKVLGVHISTNALEEADDEMRTRQAWTAFCRSVSYTHLRAHETSAHL
eukprot:14087876-Alexandrium_andersonii.AAC.1